MWSLVLVADVLFCQFTDALEIVTVLAQSQSLTHLAVQFGQIIIGSVGGLQSIGLEASQCSLFLHDAHPRFHVETCWPDAFGGIFLDTAHNSGFLSRIACTNLHGVQYACGYPEALQGGKDGLYIWRKVGDVQHRQGIRSKLRLYQQGAKKHFLDVHRSTSIFCQSSPPGFNISQCADSIGLPAFQNAVNVPPLAHVVLCRFINRSLDNFHRVDLAPALELV